MNNNNPNDYLEDLCLYDPRNPLSSQHPENGGPSEDAPEPRKDCSCDSCFYGRDPLALQILDLEARLEHARNWIKGIDVNEYIAYQISAGKQM